MFGETNGFYWLTEAAATQEARIGDELRRARFVALRLTALFAVLTLWASYSEALSRAAKIAALLVGIVPILLLAPGHTAITLAAARNQDLDIWRRFREQLLRGPAYLLMSMLQWLVLLTLIPAIWPFAGIFHARLSLACFLMVDKGWGPVRAFFSSYDLTRSHIFALIGLSWRNWLDALPRYGFFLADARGRTRRAIAEAMAYDYLRRLADLPADAPIPLPPGVSGPSGSPTSGTTASPDVRGVFPSQSPVLEAPPPPPSPLSPGELGCPRCSIALVPVVADSFHLCTSCHGIFVDNALSQGVSQGRYPTPESMHRGFYPEAPGAKVDLHAPVACPVCSARTHRTHVVGARVHVDACAEHGTWLDGDELHALVHSARKDQQDRQDPRRARVRKPRLSDRSRC